MEKDIYEIIQKWHNLYKDGTITEDEFNTKKNELLNNEVVLENSKKIDFSNQTYKEDETITNIQSKNNKKIIYIISSIFILVLISFLIFYNKTDFKSSENTKNEYSNLLKNYLIEQWTLEKNNQENDDTTLRIGKIYEEDEKLIIDNEDGWSLSSYDLKNITFSEGDLNNDKVSEVIVSITNSGGGAGGNVAIEEYYIYIKTKNNKYSIEKIKYKLNNPPKNQYGFKYWINDIKNNYIHINLQFYTKNDVKYPNGKEVELKCKLKDNQLYVIDENIDEYNNYSNKIRKLLIEEEKRNFNKIEKYYAKIIERYWNVTFISHSELKRQYENAWNISSNSKNQVQSIKRIRKNIYLLNTIYSFLDLKTNKEKSFYSTIQYVFNENGKIIKVYKK